LDAITEFYERLNAEATAAYTSSPFSVLSQDYFSRFWHDPQVTPQPDEIELDERWSIVLPPDASNLCRIMAEHLRDFLQRRMDVSVNIQRAVDGPIIQLSEQGGGEAGSAESFSIEAQLDHVLVAGADAAGLRDGIVKLVDLMGLRRAPLLATRRCVYKPRLAVRLGATPWLGSSREAVFLGYNARWVNPGGNVFALSTSAAIPELAHFQNSESLDKLAADVHEAREYGLKTYVILTTPKFAHDDAVFMAHPELRGALTWQENGLHVLCMEHPLTQQYLTETMAGLWQRVPHLDGVVIIVGGEGFYHCFMRPYGVAKGHTNCARCETLGAETAVSNMVNRMSAAARGVNPDAEIVAWPYSAIHIWSHDPAEIPFIEKLKPGAALFTEMEKDEYVTTPEGVRKHLWDYSIHLIGPGDRARRQIAAASALGIPVHVKSEPELSFEAPRLPHVPCLDLWLERAAAMASCGASGAWVFPAFRQLYGSSAAEIYKYAWWQPCPPPEEILSQLANRMAGAQGGPHLRAAWRLVSEAIPFAPELPPYYQGPYYLGPAHPMCADPAAELPPVFFGRYLFHAEMTPEDGLRLKPTFITSPRGDVPVFLRSYRRMEELLRRAHDEIEAAQTLVPQACRVVFDAEASALQWFYRTVRAHANFYESCQLRDHFFAPDESPQMSDEQARERLKRWHEVLQDEQENTRAALPLMEADVRLDWHYGGDHSFPHGAAMLRAKLELMDAEINQLLPQLERRLISGS